MALDFFRARCRTLALTALAFGLSISGFAGPAWRSDRLILVPKAGAENALSKMHQKRGYHLRRHFPALGGIEVIDLAPGQDPRDAASEYAASGLVEFAEPDYRIYASAVPNDPGFAKCWGLSNSGQNGGTAKADIDATDAWDVQNSASNIVVAVVDSGVRYTHEDLAANMWHNPRETENGRDDDGNGVADDIYGYNAIDGTGDPYDDCGHGTHVAGIIGGVANNGKGVAGVCWKVQIMALKFMDASGEGDTSDAITCVNYARTHGAKVINASWGSSYGSYALKNAINSARSAGIIFVAAAGNELANNDRTPSYPANYNLDNVISVAATNDRDELDAQYSNYGAVTVDIAAPGTAIYSTWNTSDQAYMTLSGTSMATPHVTGAIALLRAAYPADSYSKIISRLYAAADKLPSLAGKCVTGGRLNIGKLFPHTAATGAETNTPPVLTLASANGSTLNLSLNAGAQLESSTNLVDWTPVDSTALTALANGVQVRAPADETCRFYRARAN